MRYPKDHRQNVRRRLLEHGGSHAQERPGSAAAAWMLSLPRLVSRAERSTSNSMANRTSSRRSSRPNFSARRSGTSPVPEGDPDAAARVDHPGYLSARHVDHPEEGCLLPSLTPEVARADETVRSVFQAGVLDVHAALERLTGSNDAGLGAHCSERGSSDDPPGPCRTSESDVNCCPRRGAQGRPISRGKRPAVARARCRESCHGAGLTLVIKCSYIKCAHYLQPMKRQLTLQDRGLDMRRAGEVFAGLDFTRADAA